MFRELLTRKSFMILGILMLIVVISAIITGQLPQYYRLAIDHGVIEQDNNYLLYVLGIIILLSFINGILKYVTSIYINSTGINVSKNLKEKVINKVFHSPMNFFDKVSCGELVQRIKEVDAISSVFTPQVMILIISIFTAIYALFMIIRINVIFLLIYIVAIPIISIISYKLSVYYRKKTHEIVLLNAKSSQVVHESISGINEVKSLNNVEARQNTINQLNKEIYSKSKHQNKIFSANLEVLKLINVFVSVALILLYSMLLSGDKVTIGEYIELTQYSALILAPAQQSSSFLTMIQPIIILLKRLTFFDKTTHQDEKKGLKIDKIVSIKIDNLEFSYENKNVINSICSEIGNNEKLAIIGSNGSGKTTIIKLLIRLYDDYLGKISFNGIDSKKIAIESIRNNISIVFQEVFLFNGSILENIICGSTVSKDKVLLIMKSIDLKSKFDNMPYENLLNLNILEGGKNLSGGQKKMIAIARALVKDPSVLVLDEPTANLDIKSKELVRSVIKEINNKIVIIISHDNDDALLSDKTLNLDT